MADAELEIPVVINYKRTPTRSDLPGSRPATSSELGTMELCTMELGKLIPALTAGAAAICYTGGAVLPRWLAPRHLDRSWETEWREWAAEIDESCKAGALKPARPVSAWAGKVLHHLFWGPTFWGSGRLERLQRWRPAGQMIDGDALVLVRLGGAICGHAIYVHGGFTSALFDEVFGFQFGALNREAKLGKTSFTGNLTVDYRKPLPKNGTYLCRLWVEKVVDGRKGYLKGQIEGRDGTVYAESTSIYIVPRTHTTPELCDKRVKDFTAPPRAGS